MAPFLSVASQKEWLQLLVLVLIAFVGFASRLFSVIRFESIIHEFDPWFNYRATQKLVESGSYEFWNWFDDFSWYPLGRVVGGTVYPGIMFTSGLIHWVLNALNFPIHIREVCVFLAPIFSGLTAWAAYLLTSEMKDSSAGLLAAAFVAVVPGYISRSVAGSYDNEAIAIFILCMTFFLWIKALKLGSAFWAGLAALFYFYMVASWGGYAFITNLVPLHVFVLLLMGRYSTRMYVAYTTWYAIGVISAMQIPFVGFQPVSTSEHMAALGIFGLLQIVAFVNYVRSFVSEKQFQILFQAFIVVAAAIMFVVLVLATMTGVVAPWTGRFYSLWDTGYAKKYIPIIASVSEHQPTAWPSFIFDLHFLIAVFPAGVYFCFRRLKDEHVFVIVYAVTAAYFSGVMVRLMLTLTPIVCVASAVAVSEVLDTYLKTGNGEKTVTAAAPAGTATEVPSPATATPGKAAAPVKAPTARSAEEKAFLPNPSYAVVFVVVVILLQFVWHCTWVTSNAYSSPSVVLASRAHDGSQLIIDDFREAYYWLMQNTPQDAKVMSWWDYGYQIAGMANRTTLVDNNTWNNTHIATVGKAMSSREEVSYEIMRKHDVDYVLIIFGGAIGYSGDDINKYLWMIRIAEGIWPDEVSERSFFTESGEYKVDDGATATMKNSLMYKMSYYRFGELFPQGQGYDRVRGSAIPRKPIKLTVIDEVFSSENLIVRIYQVKKQDVLGRTFEAVSEFQEGKRRRKQAKKNKVR